MIEAARSPAIAHPNATYILPMVRGAETPASAPNKLQKSLDVEVIKDPRKLWPCEYRCSDGKCNHFELTSLAITFI